VFPTHSNSVSNQNGINAALSQVTADNWRWHVFDTIKGGDWLGDQTAINYMCKNAPLMVRELQGLGVEFRKNEAGKLDQGRLGGHSINYGYGDVAHRSVYTVSNENGHSLVHSFLDRALDFDTSFFVEYFALDLLMGKKNTFIN
jgi:succinate dehydrogenase/fumarate reductase flavoprotein subunit